jgi:hypothetical protein
MRKRPTLEPLRASRRTVLPSTARAVATANSPHGNPAAPCPGQFVAHPMIIQETKNDKT